jgi:hypothetical protein
VAFASDFGRVAAVGFGGICASVCAIAAIVLYILGMSRDPRPFQGFAHVIGTLGLLAGLFGAMFAAGEFARQDWTFAAFVLGSLVADIAAFAWFERRCEQAAKQGAEDPLRE